MLIHERNDVIRRLLRVNRRARCILRLDEARTTRGEGLLGWRTASPLRRMRLRGREGACLRAWLVTLPLERLSLVEVLRRRGSWRPRLRGRCQLRYHDERNYLLKDRSWLYLGGC